MEPYFILYEVLLVRICLKLTKIIGMHKIYQSFKQDLDQMYAGHQKHRQNTPKSASCCFISKMAFYFKRFHKSLVGCVLLYNY